LAAIGRDYPMANLLFNYLFLLISRLGLFLVLLPPFLMH
jgi:hypothetical protein